MKKVLPALISAIAALFLSGCLQNETTIHLNQDGSGTLVEETRFGAQMVAMMDQMSALGGEADAADPMAEMFSADKAKKRATTLGEGVTFEKSEKVEANGSKGARITYRFKDINKLRVSTDGNMKDLSPMGQMAGAAIPEEDTPDPITFTFADGKLTIKLPQPDEAGQAEDAEHMTPDMDNPEMQAMMKQMLGDMKMSLKLVVEPGIAKTDATHTDGNTITLMEMNMGKLVENPDNLKKLTSIDQKNPSKAMEQLKGVEGVKFEAKESVSVELK